MMTVCIALHTSWAYLPFSWHKHIINDIYRITEIEIENVWSINDYMYFILFIDWNICKIFSFDPFIHFTAFYFFFLFFHTFRSYQWTKALFTIDITHIFMVNVPLNKTMHCHIFILSLGLGQTIENHWKWRNEKTKRPIYARTQMVGNAMKFNTKYFQKEQQKIGTKNANEWESQFPFTNGQKPTKKKKKMKMVKLVKYICLSNWWVHFSSFFFFSLNICVRK